MLIIQYKLVVSNVNYNEEDRTLLQLSPEN